MAGPPRIIYLDVDDEITSAAARIRSADAPRVALVVPPGSRVSTSRINFRLLAREALESGRQLSIVAPDAASRSLAGAAGLDVYRTVGEFEEADAAGRAGGPGGAGAAIAGAATAATIAGSTPRGSAPGEAPSEAMAAPAKVPAEAPDARGDGSTAASAQGSRPSAARSSGPSAASGAVVATGIAGAGGPPAEELRPRSAVAGVRAVSPPAVGMSTRRILLGGGLVAVLVLLGIAAVAAYLLLPQATIVVVPRVETVGPVQTTVTADPAATTTDVANAVVPAQTVSMPVQANGTFKATGQNVTQTTATGTVTFTSQNTLFDVTVPAGTDISTSSGVHFVTTQDVVVPRASFATGPTSVNAPITALKPGPSGNVPAGSITSEPATLTAALISVTNAQPTSGGSRTITPKVAQSDVDAAVASLKKQLGDAFAGQLSAGTNVPAGLVLFPETGTLGTAAFTPDPASLVGQQVAQFTLAASATGTATAVDEAPVTSIAETRLRAQVPAGYSLVAGSVLVTTGTPTVDGAKVMFPTSATASQVRQLDAAALETEVRGLPVDQAKQQLEQYGTVTITTWPDWVSTIPTYDFRVDLTVEPAATVEPSGSAPAVTPSAAAPASSAPSASAAAPSPSAPSPSP